MILDRRGVEFLSPTSRIRRIALPSFGEKLKLERERQNITLDQVSVSTKIAIRMLRAIEEDNFNQLPGGIFNKGFIRAYARVLGLDEEQTLADYRKASGNDVSPSQADSPLQNPASAASVRHGSSLESASADRENSKHELNLDRVEAASRPLDNQLPWGIFAALLLLVALMLSLWSRFERSHTTEAARAPVSNPAPTSPSPTVPVQTLPIQTLPAQTLPAPPRTSAAPETRAPATHTPSPTSAAYIGGSSPGIAASPSPSPSEFSLVIQARKESWITITADGKPLSSELMTAGTERTVHGRKQVIVKAGNAGAIEFQLNGQKFPAPGEYGQVKTVTFGPTGII
jgi:cytoskeleton protein RodZ